MTARWTVRQAWTRLQQPGWTVRLIPRASRRAAALHDAGADDATLVDACLAGRPRGVRRDRRAPPAAGLPALLSVRRQSRRRERSRAGRLHPRVSRAAQFKGQSALGTWLYRIGVNVCLNRVGARTPTSTTARRDRARRHPRRSAPTRRCCAASARRRSGRRSRGCRRNSAPTLILRVYHELPHEQIAGDPRQLGGRGEGELLSRARKPEEAAAGLSHESLWNTDGVRRRLARRHACAERSVTSRRAQRAGRTAADLRAHHWRGAERTRVPSRRRFFWDHFVGARRRRDSRSGARAAPSLRRVEVRRADGRHGPPLSRP